MFGAIKDYIIAIGGAVIAVLFGLLRYEKYKREQAEERVEMQADDMIVNEFQSINKERADHVEDTAGTVKPDTEYRL